MSAFSLASEGAAVAVILIAVAIGFMFSVVSVLHIKAIKIDSSQAAHYAASEKRSLVQTDAATRMDSVLIRVNEITEAIQEGARAFLVAEIRVVAIFVVVFAAILAAFLCTAVSVSSGLLSAVAFIIGVLTSVASSFIGMTIATRANGKTAVKAIEGLAPAFRVALTAGTVMGFCLTALGLLNLFVLIVLYKQHWSSDGDVSTLYETIAGYGLGGSTFALFSRVGGGIFTKAADVGADLVGKVEKNIPEDDPRNPAVVADNVGDNVGDIAGMGADLFGSFAEATCAALVILATSDDPRVTHSFTCMLFPLIVSATGLMVSIATSIIALYFTKVQTIEMIEPTLKRQLLISTVLMTPVLYLISQAFLPDTFNVKVGGDVKETTNLKVFACTLCGLWSGLIIGYITEYFTSHAYSPVRDVATSCQTGAATNIIYGLALGYKSTIIPAGALAVSIYVSYTLASMFGVACAALGILSTIGIGLAIDAYGPISDNAGGIAEMAGMGSHIREKTDALDAAGNTTAAIGKGYAVGSAAFTSLALFGAFVARVGLDTVNILDAYPFAALLFGAMLPYWFSALTMKSVGKAALDMVQEVRRQFAQIPGLMEGTARPEYARCVAISTEASLKKMIAPGLMVILSPLLVGFLFGKKALAGLLAGILVSGVHFGVSSSNSGGAWDNAKKYIESGHYGGKGGDAHKAAVTGDTVGDPLKDTSGPSLNILVKLSAIISVVFAPAIASYSLLG